MKKKTMFFLFLLFLSIILISCKKNTSDNNISSNSSSETSSISETDVSKNTETLTINDYSGSRRLPIYSTERSEKIVSLSFDAAWGTTHTQTLLTILDNYNLKCNFFLTGGWVDENPEYVKIIVQKGHELGNHSKSHPDLTKLSVQEQTEEIMYVHNKVKELTGYNMCLFRPPYGAYNNDLINTLYTNNYYPIQWTVDSLDWKGGSADTLVETVCNHPALQNGSIVLMHNDGEHTAEALPRIIENLQNQGYTIVPISQLILHNNFYIDGTGRQHVK